VRFARYLSTLGREAAVKDQEPDEIELAAISIFARLKRLSFHEQLEVLALAAHMLFVRAVRRGV
jgi:hypothetical protein